MAVVLGAEPDDSSASGDGSWSPPWEEYPDLAVLIASAPLPSREVIEILRGYLPATRHPKAAAPKRNR
jgi:hypothetical protein